jgi:arsenate reductase
MTREHIYHVVFLCTGNTARSILAEAALNRAGKDRFRASSAGSQPKGAVHPDALRLLQTEGYDSDQFRSKSWDEFTRPGAPGIDFVLTLCDSAARESCPIWPGHPVTAHWGMADPAAVGDETRRQAAFAETLRVLDRRIARLLGVPFASLDAAGRKRLLADIGGDS